MPSIDDYGSAITATTAALEQLIEGATPLVTTRTPDVAGVGLNGASVNVFLYRDALVTYRDGGDPRGTGHILVELNYLVSTHAGDDADTNLLSQRAYGAARATIERNPVLTVQVDPGGPVQVRLTTTSLTLDDLTSLWIASTAPLRLSFGVTAAIALRADDPSSIAGTLGDVVRNAGPGVLVAFSGSDAPSKSAAAKAVATDIGQPIVQVALDQIVSKYIGETEQNLQRLFDSAETADFVLFFDEADALFGRRTVVRDSHDRYADVEVDPILDLLSRAPGVVIFGLAETGAELGARTSVEVRFPPHDR
jgi:hypothetical protein